MNISDDEFSAKVMFFPFYWENIELGDKSSKVNLYWPKSLVQFGIDQI